MKMIRENELSPESIVNLLVRSSDLGLKNGFVVQTNHKSVMDCIELAQKKTEEQRIALLMKVRETIKVGNAFFDRPENLQMVGKCKAWDDLMDDCVIYLCLQFVQNGSLLVILTDEELAEMAQNPRTTHNGLNLGGRHE